jgi:hypothetical protein
VFLLYVDIAVTVSSGLQYFLLANNQVQVM